MTPSLEGTIERHVAARAPDAVVALGNLLRERFGAHAQAVLFYGSCRRAHDDAGGIVDLYVLVDDYRAAYGALLPAEADFLNRITAYFDLAELDARRVMEAILIKNRY